MHARRRFQRYVALLLAITLPALAVGEMVQAPSPGASLLLSGYGVLCVWAIYVIRSKSARVVPLLLAIMFYLASLIIVESLMTTEITAFEFPSTFGLMIVLSVLTGGLVAGSRLVWAAGLAASLAAWVATVGYLDNETRGAIGIRVVVALAGVVFTTALVSDLFDQLGETIQIHERATRLQDAIASCSEALLVHSDEFAVYEAARALIDATEADYVYVDRTTYEDGEPFWEIIAEAVTDLDPRGGGRWKKGSYRQIPTTWDELSAGRAIVIDPRQLDPTEGSLYMDDGILSEVSVPIMLGTQMRGSVGFIQYREARVWTDDEIQTLWRASHMIAAYWKRQDDAAQLRESNDSKDRLLASVSHEIRTPLTAIVGLSEEMVASRANMSDEEMDELNTIIAVQSRELAELVEDLLVASRADFGNLSIKSEEIDLYDQVQRVVQGVRESHPTYKHLSVVGGPTLAWADPLRVRQVIRNLLTNAVKYGGDRIAIEVANRGNRAMVVVTDDGAGVPEAEQELIFERYYRSTQSPTLPGSVGIGLPVSRQLAEMMDGSLEYVRSGRYPRFELNLPAVSPDLELEAEMASASGS